MQHPIARWTRRNAIALAALFIALGGTAFAATVAKNSVTSKSVKNGSLKGADLARDTLTGTQINEATLNGIAGPKGDRGAPGPPGTPGVQGPAGPGAKALSYRSGPAPGRTDLAQIGPLTFTAQCEVQSNDLLARLHVDTSTPATGFVRDVLWRDNTEDPALSSSSVPFEITTTSGLASADAESAANPPREAVELDATLVAGGDSFFVHAWVASEDVTGTGPETDGTCSVLGYAFRTG
jgi:hypothetical protein